MDFAFCPHCHQSVLDEDAEVCPFCGGSMQGGSKGSAPPPKPAATAKPASKSTSKDSKLLEEFPFEVEPRKLVAEFRVSPAPSKTRSLKVVCPMCDLTGYVPEAAAGKTVMCYNSSCPMPVFTAPIPEIPLPKPPPKPQRQSQPLVWGVGTFLVVSIIGGVVWWWAGQPQVDLVVKPLTPEDLQRLKSQQPVVNQPSETSPNEVPTTSAMPQREENTQPTPTLDYTAAVLRLIEPTVLQNNNNRSKPYCRRLAAETVALAGHPELSWGHLEQAVRLGPNVTFYRIPGLCEVFWQAYRHHQQEEARKALDAALSEVTHLPTFGRDRLELALKLAPPLLTVGRSAEAADLQRRFQQSGFEGELACLLERLSLAPVISPEDVSWEYPALWIHQTPQIAEVGVITAQRLGLAAVPPWIELFSEPTIRAECLARWGEHLAPGNQLPADWQRLVADLPTAQRTWVLSRVARASQRAGQEELSQQTHAQLVPLLQAAPEPRPFTMPETAELVRWQKPSWEDHALWAAAGAQHAFWLQRARQTAQAEEWLETALQHCRAIGPTLPAIQQRLDEAEKLGATGLRQKIKTELDLRNDDEARQRIGAYRQGLTDVEAAAQERFRLQTAILVAAIREGMVDPAWRVAHSRSLDPQPLQREPYLTSEVGQWLAETYRRQNDAQQQQALRVAQEQLGAKPLARPWLAELEEARQARRWPEIHAVLARRDFKDLADDLDLWLTLQIAAQEPPDVVFNWIHSHREMTLREAAWEWAAVILTRRQLTSVVYEQIETISQATEKMSLIKGLVLGLHPYTPPMTAAPQTSYRPLQGAHDAPTVQR